MLIGQFDRREAKSRKKPGLPLAAWGVSRRGTRRPGRRPGSATRCAGRGPGPASRPGRGGSGRPPASGSRLPAERAEPRGLVAPPAERLQASSGKISNACVLSNKYGWLLFARSAAFCCALKANLMQKVSYLFIQGW